MNLDENRGRGVCVEKRSGSFVHHPAFIDPVNFKEIPSVVSTGTSSNSRQEGASTVTIRENGVFEISLGAHTLIGDILSSNSMVRVLVLHGAGSSDRGRFRPLRERLFEEGISSAAFDFVGHGETGGDLTASCLENRTRQAMRVIDSLEFEHPMSVIGASMGAYTAVRLLRRREIDRLILLVPAMYAASAYTARFNGEFTRIIRTPKSWEASDAWDVIRGYTGRLLTIAGEKDEVIPKGVIEQIHHSAINAEKRELYMAPNASHFVFTDLRAHNPDELERVLRRIATFLKK